jgi:hypothetical protein
LSSGPQETLGLIERGRFSFNGANLNGKKISKGLHIVKNSLLEFLKLET